MKNPLSKIKYMENIPFKYPQRSIPACIFLIRNAEGSFAIEAAVALPVILMVLISVIQLFTAAVFQVRLTHAMEQVGRRLSYYYYAAAELTEEEQKEASAAVKSVIIAAVSETLVKGLITEELSTITSGDMLIEGGTGGISYLMSYYDPSTESIHLNASYRIRFLFLPVRGFTIPVEQATSHRVWTGREMEETEEEEIVYIAESGKVYHTALSCTYLSLKINEVKRSKVGDLRNAEGGKYYECELCRDTGGTNVFISTYGARFHYDKNCSGLKRTIESIPISKVGDRTLCKRCQKRHVA